MGISAVGEIRERKNARVRERSRRDNGREGMASMAQREQTGERTAVREATRKEYKQANREPNHAAPTLLTVWLEDQPGNPLGKGMPSGEPLRMDGESHSNAWRRILRADPCSYCGAPCAGTVDHVHPRSQRQRDTERWQNLVAACGPCNTAKSARPLLEWLLVNRDRLAQVAAIEQSLDRDPPPYADRATIVSPTHELRSKSPSRIDIAIGNVRNTLPN